jgi:hypothetical protein
LDGSEIELTPRARNPLASQESVELAGFRLMGACRLDDPEFAGGSFVFGALVKHGTNSMFYLSRKCKSKRLHFWGHGEDARALLIGQRLHDLLEEARGQYLVLPVRGQASFHKSVYNHVCNKVNGEKEFARARHHIDCNARDEFFHLRSLDFQEMALKCNPNLIRDVVVAAKPEHLIFIDYKALQNLTDPFCRGTLSAIEGSVQMNDAAAQNYTDYYSKWNVVPWSFSQQWDAMYDQLQQVSCLHYARLDDSEGRSP